MRSALALALALIATTAGSLAQEAPREVAPYCEVLKHIANLAMTKERFASIIGKPREGNYLATTMPLAGWGDCSLYGPRTYTCDSHVLPSAEEAEKAERQIARQIVDCLGPTWREIKEQSSRGYLVLHPALGPASITLNLDRTGPDDGYVVRFTLFLRSLASPR